jgi:hypothetical protein
MGLPACGTRHHDIGQGHVDGRVLTELLGGGFTLFRTLLNVAQDADRHLRHARVPRCQGQLAVSGLEFSRSVHDTLFEVRVDLGQPLVGGVRTLTAGARMSSDRMEARISSRP